MNNGVTISPELSLRLMAEVGDEDAVAQLIAVLQTGLARFAGIEKWSCARYWKNPEYFEIQLQLQPVGEMVAAYQGIIALLPTWEHQAEETAYADQEALWNRVIDPDACFLHPAINWVQVFLNCRAILPHPPKFRAGKRVRWIGAPDPNYPEEAALSGTTAIVQNVWPNFAGHYDYSAAFEQAAEDAPLLWAREDELEWP